MNERQKVIYEIQDYLRNISYYNEKLPFIASDGIYGEETRQAVQVFQQLYELEQSGKVDFQTWKKLVEENERATQSLSQPFAVAPVDDSDLPVERGDKGPIVKHVKLMLDFLSENYDNFEKQTDTDEFDLGTFTEIQRWQRVAFLPQTGKVDKQTWNMLSEYYTV